MYVVHVVHCQKPVGKHVFTATKASHSHLGLGTRKGTAANPCASVTCYQKRQILEYLRNSAILLSAMGLGLEILVIENPQKLPDKLACLSLCVRLKISLVMFLLRRMYVQVLGTSPSLEASWAFPLLTSLCLHF